MDLSKIEAGSLELHTEEFNLAESVNDVLTMLSPQISQKKLDIKLNISNKIPKLIIQDSLRLQQVLTNLINNAIKFTQKGSISLDIKLIQQEFHNHTLKFEIKDTGIGISKGEIKSLFSSFSQADTSTTRKFGGTGLGLVISKNLVEKMSGNIGVESTLKQGSTFWFTLPVRLMNSCGENNLRSMRTNKTMQRSLRILVAEDNQDNLDMILDMLTLKGHDVSVARNGQESIDLAQSFYPDIILMDMRMPVMSGFEATKILREMPQFSEIPIIALTASAGTDNKEQCLQAGCTLHVAKPVKSARLYSAIDKVTNSKSAT